MFQSNEYQLFKWFTFVRGVGGKLSRLVYLAPTQDLGQTVSSVNSYCIIILEYLVGRDVNFISDKLRCLHLTFSSVSLVRGVGASCPGWFIPPPPHDLSQTVSSVNFYCTIILEYLVGGDVNIISDSQTEMFTSNVQFDYPSPSGVGGGCPGWFILPPAQDLGQIVSSVNSYRTIILEYLVFRDVNIISAKLNCGLSIL